MTGTAFRQWDRSPFSLAKWLQCDVSSIVDSGICYHQETQICVESSPRLMRDIPRLRRLMAFARPELGENSEEYRLGRDPATLWPTCFV